MLYISTDIGCTERVRQQDFHHLLLYSLHQTIWMYIIIKVKLFISSQLLHFIHAMQTNVSLFNKSSVVQEPTIYPASCSIKTGYFLSQGLA